MRAPNRGGFEEFIQPCVTIAVSGRTRQSQPTHRRGTPARTAHAPSRGSRARSHAAVSRRADAQAVSRPKAVSRTSRERRIITLSHLSIDRPYTPQDSMRGAVPAAVIRFHHAGRWVPTSGRHIRSERAARSVPARMRTARPGPALDAGPACGPSVRHLRPPRSHPLPPARTAHTHAGPEACAHTTEESTACGRRRPDRPTPVPCAYQAPMRRTVRGSALCFCGGEVLS